MRDILNHLSIFLSLLKYGIKKNIYEANKTDEI